ncbi:MAG: hypothetical protein JW982_12165 [Spirochaetes bacterium]|nr:hypothetical protein [Spirochaetota bacterium]
MKPLKITLEGIGSYRLKQSIDFSSYDDFFLITGDTGAGKTTIFDAIMFSLYGEVSGTRNGSDLVYSGLDYDVIPFCEFTFRLARRTFRVRRSPSYDRKKRKGTGYTNQPETVVFSEFKNQEWVDYPGNKTDIDGKIQEFVKFNADEFSRLILLPQGEFQKFLISETKEKRELLEKIFPVDLYKKCAARFNEMKNELAAEKKQISKALDEKMKIFDPVKYGENHAVLLKIKNELTKSISELNISVKEKSSELADSENVIKLFAELDEKKSEQEKLILQKKEINSLELKLENYRYFLKHKPVIDKYNYIQENREKSSRTISELKDNLLKTKESFLKLKEDYSKLPKWRKEISNREYGLDRLILLLPEYKISKGLQTDSVILSDDLRKSEKELQNNSQELVRLEEKLNSLNEFKVKNKDAADSNIMLSEQINAFEIKLREHNICRQYFNKAAALKSEIEKDETNLEKEIKILHELSGQLAECRKNDELYYLQKLSEKITDNIPCPVCGSLEHPAVFSTDKKITSETARVERLESEKSLKDKVRVSLEKEIEMKKLNLAEINNLFIAGINYDKEINQIDNEISELKKRYKFNSGLMEKMAENEKIFSEHLKFKDSLNSMNRALTDKINTIKIKLSENTAFIKNNSDQLKDLEIRFSEDSGYFSNISEQLEKEKDFQEIIEDLRKSIAKGVEIVSVTEKKFVEENEKRIQIETEIKNYENSIHEFETELNSLKKELDVILKNEKLESMEQLQLFMISDAELNDIEKRINLYREASAKNSESLKFYEKKLKNTEKPDIIRIKSELTGIESQIADLTAKRDENNEKIIMLENKKKEYEFILNRLSELNEKHSDVEKMALILNGTNSRNITFQDYVLAGYLQEVLNKANRRLIRISDGQYQLKRRNEKERGSTKSGLEFNVIDIFNGKEREVQSLSGGEKFLTSLCLALGLSDVIQSRSGGNELEALFIDEGFGSLDERSLERAISILDEIRGSRIVGIISHVKELKTRIPSVIEIKKTLSGSQILKN